jgi:sulfite reductase (NADPH) flavoprotein alpha-component
MNLVPIIPENAPFNADQRAWLNGFLAGVLGRSTPSAVSTESSTKINLLIAFGSQSGNAESYSKKLAKSATAKGFAARAVSLENIKPSDLAKDKNVLIVTSTWGEGDPPDNAVNFWNELESAEAPSMNGVNYSVLALGDFNYADTFCLAGKKIDARIEELGGNRITPRIDCDVEYEELAKKWSDEALAILQASGSTDSTPATNSNPSSTEESSAESGYSKKNPFPAPLIANIALNSQASSKDTRHIAFSLKDSGLSYEVGDALGVYVKNCPEVAEQVISAYGFSPDLEVSLPDNKGKTTLRQALIEHYEIRALLGKPAESINIESFIENLRKLQPRLYSIASSPKAHPEEVHLCVGAVRYEQDGIKHKGVASTYLADRLSISDTAGVFFHEAKHFRLPTDLTKPVIMIGPGTGIAPFRAFLEEREATQSSGKNWLFFGDQKRSHDFLYHEQITGWIKTGLLTRLDTAFSRDQAEKVYVQNRMLSAGDELWQWLEEGAHFYVCGDAKRMAKDVDAALHQIIQTAGNKSEQEAVDYVNAMKKNKRYQRDVY